MQLHWENTVESSEKNAVWVPQCSFKSFLILKTEEFVTTFFNVTLLSVKSDCQKAIRETKNKK